MKDSVDKRKGASAAKVTVGVRLQTRELAAIDAFIGKQPEPRPSRAEAVRKLIDLGLAADRVERASAREAKARAAQADADRARLEYEKAQIAEREKTERLRRVRLAKEEHDRRVAAGEQTPPRRDAAARAKELAVGAVKQALAQVDAPDEEKIERKRKLVAPPPTGPIRRDRQPD